MTISQRTVMQDIYWIIDTSKLQKSEYVKWYNFTVPVPVTIINAAQNGYDIGLVAGRLELKEPTHFYLYGNIGESQLINNHYQEVLASINLQRDATFSMYYIHYVKMKPSLPTEIRLYIDRDKVNHLISSGAASEELTIILIFHCRPSLYNNENK